MSDPRAWPAARAPRPELSLPAQAGRSEPIGGEPRPRHLHDAFLAAHRALGLALVILPPLALLRGSANWRVHLENMREGCRWTADDVRWLLLFPRNAMDPRVTLPEQGKFNAAEKLNFMMVSTFYPLYIVTGLMVRLPGVAFFPYLAHLVMAGLGVLLVLGHIFMATVNPDTKVGLSGMFTGWVDRNWARHHYRRWYREHFEPNEMVADLATRLRRPAKVRCKDCREVHAFETWKHLLERSFQAEPMFCPACETGIRIGDADREGSAADSILRHIEHTGPDEPLDSEASGAA